MTHAQSTAPTRTAGNPKEGTVKPIRYPPPGRRRLTWWDATGSRVLGRRADAKTRRRALAQLAAAAAVSSFSLIGGAAAAGASASLDPAPPSRQSALLLQAHVAGELVQLRSLGENSTPNSPARFRIADQAETVAEQARTVGQLLGAFQVFDEATPGSPAQWRAGESATELASELRAIDADLSFEGASLYLGAISHDYAASPGPPLPVSSGVLDACPDAGTGQRP
jgi:hypothetical protein